MLLGRVQVAPGGVELRPRRSLEVRGSPELQNGGLRALEEAWITTFRSTHFSVKFGCFLAFWRLEAGRWGWEAGGCSLEPGGWRLGAEGWEVQAGGLRLEAGGWMNKEELRSSPGTSRIAL